MKPNLVSKAHYLAEPAVPPGTLLRDLMTTRDTVKTLYRDSLARHDLSEQQWRVMVTLEGDGPLSTTKLAQSAGVLPSSLTRILVTLESRDLVLSRRDPDDARRVQLRLSARGRVLMNDMMPDIDRIERQIADAIGPGRLSSLLQGLDKTRDALSELAPPASLRRVR